MRRLNLMTISTSHRLLRHRNTLRVSADLGAHSSRAHPREKPGFSTYESDLGRETDSPLEGDGFELPVPVRQAKLTWSCRRKTGPGKAVAPPGSECCVVVGDGGCEAYTVIGWGGGLSHERGNIAEAETLGTRRRQHVRHRHARCRRSVGVEGPITSERNASEPERSHVRPQAESRLARIGKVRNRSR